MAEDSVCRNETHRGGRELYVEDYTGTKVITSVYAGKKLAERVGFESTRKRNFRELCGKMSILKHSKRSLGLVIAP